MIGPTAHLAIAFFMAFLFAQAGAHKIIAHRTFRASLRGHSIVPVFMERAVAVTLAFIELSLAVLWVLMPQSAWVGTASAVLFGLYAALLLRSHISGRGQAGCGCEWGGRSQPIELWMPARNVILAIIAMTTLAPDSGAVAGAIEILNAVAFGGFGIVAYFAISELAFVRSHAKSMLEFIHG